MIRNIQITRKGNESIDSAKTLFLSPNSWSEDGANLVLYKNNQILIKNKDYEIQDEYTVKLLSSAKSTDEINFIITQIVDPSEMYSYDERIHQLDRINKKLDGKTQTSIDKRSTEETIPSKFIIHSNDIWSSKISENSATAQKEGVAQPFVRLILTEDKTVADKKGWFSSTDNKLSGRVINWIPSGFGQSYTIRLYDAIGNEIPSSDPMNWKWDYQAGYLIIENNFLYQTPFRISGFKYVGKFGVNTGNYWKEPVFAVSDLPIYHNDDGDIRLILTENKFYRFDSLQKRWETLDYGSKSFADPVLTKSELPSLDNQRGDIRLVMDESNLYVWDDAYGLNGSWVLLTGQSFDPRNYYNITQTDLFLSGKSNLNHIHDTLYLRQEQVKDLVRWRSSRANFADLPPYTENKDGDVILTRNDNTIWRWYTDDPNNGQGHWEKIFQSNFSWKTPVDVITDLPSFDNSPGDCRLVKNEKKIYFWDGNSWGSITSNISEHNHDDRYLLKTKLNWKEPVNSYNILPLLSNESGDCRLTLDTNIIYRWHEGQNKWIQIINKSKWLEPVLLFIDLPQDAENNSITYVHELNRLCIYDGIWKTIETAIHNHDDLYYNKSEIDSFIKTHIHNGIDSPSIDYNSLLNIPYFSWKNPVADFLSLPIIDNVIGDARIVISTKSIYVWSGSLWDIISNGTFADHNHNDIYYTKSDITSLLQSMQSNLIAQLNNKADLIHNHDNRYYLKQELDAALSGKANTNHTHPVIPHDHDTRYPTYQKLSNAGQGATVHWDNIVNKPASISDAWKTPVQYELNLPQSNNSEGDLRLVLYTSDIWRWNGLEWDKIGHWEGPRADYWQAPVINFINLPQSNNFDGDIRLVKAENKLYRWNQETLKWEPLCGEGGGGGGNEPIPGGTISYTDIQVYINGIQGIENEDWERTPRSSIRILAPVDINDTISIVFVIGDIIKRYDFQGNTEGQIDINLASTFYRKEYEIASPTQTLSLPVPYNPGQKDLVVWVNGVLLRLGGDYIEKSHTEVQFIDMLGIGDRVIILILGLNEGENYFREDYTADSGQTQFLLVHEYIVGSGQLLVYLNGQLQIVGSDYIESDKKTILFNRSAEFGDLLTFIIIRGMAVGNSGNIINYASDLLLGYPTDGIWSDGFVPLHAEMNVADALDEINEAILELIPDNLASFSNIQLQPQDMEFKSGFVADGNDYIEGHPGDYFDYLTKIREFYITTPENSFSKADKGIIRLFVNGIEVDSFNLGNAFVEQDRDGNQTATHYGIKSQGAFSNVGSTGTNGAIRNSMNGYIQIMSIQKHGYKKIQKGVIKFKLYNGILRHGYNFVYATHSYYGIVDISKQFKFFIDSKHVFPDFTGTQTLFEHTLSSEKYISGVRYYSIGDKFRTTFNIVNIAYTTYVAEPISIEMPGVKTINVEYNDSNLYQISNPPHIDDIVEYKGVFTLNEFNQFSIDGVATIKTNTPFGPGSEYTFVSKNRLINTYTNGSSSLKEYFRDEIFRLPAGEYNSVPIQRSYVWDSKLPLENGNAMLFDKGLRYANMTFVDYLPEQIVDYSNFFGSQTYYRAFFKNTPHNNGEFIINGIAKNSLLSNKILIDIKLPTQTGWLSLNKFYEVAEFNGEDGDGCLIDVVDNKYYYSSGTFSTAYSGYLMVVRITLPDDSAPAITYLELKW